jgi:selenocysteine lyase/cysteine desulfurase
MSWKPYFQRSVLRPGAALHFAAHSHHPWPDVTRAAHLQAWDDAAALLDRKWEKIFSEVIPEAKAHIARVLNLPDPSTLTFAPNTHEFLTRILSALPHRRPIRVLTTDSEFHTFARQMARLEEADRVQIVRIPAEPQASFSARFAAAAAKGGFDLVFFSDVFFNSGFWVRDVATIVEAVRDPETVVVVDGYHSFMAVPLDLAALAHRAFYVSGGYKYAMAGEGACVLHCPPGYLPRPVNTGWYAEFAELADRKAGTVGYAATGDRFAGATFDPTGLYRLNAVMRWLEAERLTVSGMLDYTHDLQRRFAGLLGPDTRIDSGRLVTPLAGTARGRFLTFQTPNAQAIQKDLAAQNVLTDARGDRLRIGFGIYHDTDDLEKLVTALRA